MAGWKSCVGCPGSGLVGYFDGLALAGSSPCKMLSISSHHLNVSYNVLSLTSLEFLDSYYLDAARAY